MKTVVRRLVLLTAVLALASALLATPASGQISTRVMNGSDAAAGQYPWTVALVLPGYTPSASQFCGGSLVAPDIVLTAAHCTMGSRADEIDVFAGDHDLGDEDPGERYDVLSIHLPANAEVDPDSGAVPRRDIAILRLDAPVTGAEPIAPIDPVDAPRWSDAGDDLEVMGWGRWEQLLPAYPDILQHATLDRVSDADCAAVPGLDFAATDMVCALRVQGQKVIDSCGGDSGGPLTTIGTDPSDPTTGWKLVGTVSYGSPDCDDPRVPGVYARLGAADLRAFVEEFRAGDPTPGDDPDAQLERSGGSPVLSGTLRAGEQLACDGATTTWSQPDVTETPRVRRYDVKENELATVAVDGPYTLRAADVGHRFLCEVHASKAGVGGYGVARSGLAAEVGPAPSSGTVTPPVVTTPPTTEITPVLPPPSDPQPFVPEPRDVLAPTTSRITKRCIGRLCTFTIRASDAGSPLSGVRRLHVTLVSRYRCGRRDRRRTCVSERRLSATRVLPGFFRARAQVMRRPAAYRVEVFAIDGAGNEEARSRTLSFRLSPRAAR